VLKTHIRHWWFGTMDCNRTVEVPFRHSATRSQISTSGFESGDASTPFLISAIATFELSHSVHALLKMRKIAKSCCGAGQTLSQCSP
jgi:hypothetical protein